jgi:hypothetical protein
MKLSKLLRAVIKTIDVLPASVVADVATLGVTKITEGKSLSGNAVNSIADDLDEDTENNG